MSSEIIHALVPHPDSGAVLVVDDGYTLPTVRGNADDEIDVRLSALEREHGIDSPFLRRVAAVTKDDGELILKEFEAVPAHGRQWLPLDKLSLLRLPEELRPGVERWVEYQRGREPGAYRPAWARPGWYARTRAWLTDTLATRGIEAVGRPSIVQQWAISSVLRQPTRGHGDYFLKSVFGGPGRAFWHEPALSAALDREHPGTVAAVTAIDSERGLMVMPDMAVTVFDERPQDEWDAGLRSLAAIQREWVGRRAEVLALGCPDRSPATLADDIAAAAADERVTGGLSDAERARIDQLLPRFRRLCDEAIDWPVPLTLIHGDCHPANAGVRENGGVCVFDWSDGAWTHPFLDVPVYTRRLSGEARVRAWDTYLEYWSDYVPPQELRELVPTATILTALYQVVTYRGIISNLDPDDHFVFGTGAGTHWRMALDTWDADG